MAVEYSWANEQLDRLPAMAANLVRTACAEAENFRVCSQPRCAAFGTTGVRRLEPDPIHSAIAKAIETRARVK